MKTHDGIYVPVGSLTLIEGKSTHTSLWVTLDGNTQLAFDSTCIRVRSAILSYVEALVWQPTNGSN